MDCRRSKAEYGGYLPLKLPQGKEYFQLPDQDIRRYNCGRTAIYEAAQAMDIQRVWVPYYICHTVAQALEAAGVHVERFSLNEALEPAAVPNNYGEREALLLVNYFGLGNHFLRKMAEKYERLILDCTQAFFCPPVLRPGVSNVYSCRKFIGVPDGAYLVAQDNRARKAEAGTAWKHMSYLCRAHEEGTNAAYQDSLVNEGRLGESKSGMSRITRRILRGVDYNAVRQSRRQNFAEMDQLLGSSNRLHLALEDMTPQCYPYWAPEGTGQRLKKALLERRVYIPTLWKECRELCSARSLEVAWTNDLLCLPIDQRYDGADMRFLAGTILELLEGMGQ